MAYGQYFAVGEETTWASAVARNKMAKVMAGSKLEHMPNRERSATMSSNVGADAERNFEKGQHGEGKIILPVSFDDGAGFKLLKHGVGRVASTAGAGPYVHTLDRAVTHSGGAVGAAVSLSAELNYELPDAGPLQARLLTGARVKAFTLSWNAGEERVLDVDLIGKQVTQVVKTASPVYPDYETYGGTFARVSSISIGGVNYGTVCRGLDVTVDNGHEERIRMGSVFTQRPLRRGVASISGNIRLDWEASPAAKTLWDAMNSNTLLPIIITETDGTYGIVTTMSKAYINTCDLSPDEGELQAVEFGYIAYNDATNTAFKMVITSPNATL